MGTSVSPCTEADARNIIEQGDKGIVSVAYWHADRPPHLATLPKVGQCWLHR